MKPICIPCQRFFRPKQTGFIFIEGFPQGDRVKPGTAEPEKWKPYKVWSGDKWECPGCGAQLISGVASKPIAEHYEPSFPDELKRMGTTPFQVNDC